MEFEKRGSDLVRCLAGSWHWDGKNRSRNTIQMKLKGVRKGVNGNGSGSSGKGPLKGVGKQASGEVTIKWTPKNEKSEKLKTAQWDRCTNKARLRAITKKLHLWLFKWEAEKESRGVSEVKKGKKEKRKTGDEGRTDRTESLSKQQRHQNCGHRTGEGLKRKKPERGTGKMDLALHHPNVVKTRVQGGKWKLEKTLSGSQTNQAGAKEQHLQKDKL